MLNYKDILHCTFQRQMCYLFNRYINDLFSKYTSTEIHLCIVSLSTCILINKALRGKDKSRFNFLRNVFTDFEYEV